MKKVVTPNSITKNIMFSLVFLLSISFNSYSQAKPADAAAPAATAAAAPDSGAGDATKGKELFNGNCAACHKLDAKMTGPMLRNVIAKHDKEWLYKWIANSQALIKSGDPEAVKLWEEYKPSVMNNFPQLSHGDIDNIQRSNIQDKFNDKESEGIQILFVSGNAAKV